MVLAQITPVELSNEVSLNIGQGSIYEIALFIKHAFVSPDYDAIGIFDAVSLLTVELISDNDLAFRDKIELIYFIEFFRHYCSFIDGHWLKIHQHCDHKITILLVVPCVIIPYTR